MNYRAKLVNNAVNNLTAGRKIINPELRMILDELASGHYTPETLPPHKFSALNMASEAINDRRIFNQNNKSKKGKEAL